MEQRPEHPEEIQIVEQLRNVKTYCFEKSQGHFHEYNFPDLERFNDPRTEREFVDEHEKEVGRLNREMNRNTDQWRMLFKKGENLFQWGFIFGFDFGEVYSPLHTEGFEGLIEWRIDVHRGRLLGPMHFFDEKRNLNLSQEKGNNWYLDLIGAFGTIKNRFGRNRGDFFVEPNGSSAYFNNYKSLISLSDLRRVFALTDFSYFGILSQSMERGLSLLLADEVCPHSGYELCVRDIKEDSGLPIIRGMFGCRPKNVSAEEWRNGLLYERR